MLQDESPEEQSQSQRTPVRRIKAEEAFNDEGHWPDLSPPCIDKRKRKDIAGEKKEEYYRGVAVPENFERSLLDPKGLVARQEAQHVRKEHGERG
jgi:hypothetical protein